MNRSISRKFKNNIILLSIIITGIFLVINIVLYIINNQYLVQKVENENQAFLELTTHLINENDIEIALEYAEHYVHIHEVNIEILDADRNMIFSSVVAHMYTSQYQIETLKGTFTIYMDNTNSITVNSIQENTVYINISLLIIYLIALLALVKINKSNLKEINQDISNVLRLINQDTNPKPYFYHEEFQKIYHTINEYLESIDLLTEQKEMNLKGIAHDIKTPLTIVYSYFERTIRGDQITKKDSITAFESSKRINDLLNDIILDNKQQNTQKIDIGALLSSQLENYKTIFQTKNMMIQSEIQPELYVYWNKRDYIRLIENLISNAFYYSKPDSTFVVWVYKKEKVHMEFLSTPIHIEDIQPELMFYKGYRGRSSALENHNGKGFGLYLCRILLKNIGGNITIEKLAENVKITIIL